MSDIETVPGLLFACCGGASIGFESQSDAEALAKHTLCGMMYFNTAFEVPPSTLEMRSVSLLEMTWLPCMAE